MKMPFKTPPWTRVALKYTMRSFAEFRYLVALSLMPVWLGTIFRLISGDDAVAYMNGYLSNGEALLICSATVGPLLYTVISDKESSDGMPRQFPGKETYTLLIVVVCVVSAGLLGFKTALLAAGGSPVSVDALWLLSAITSVASIAIWFAVTGTREARDQGATSIMRMDTADFIEDYKSDQ
jgi:hypothetical protein